MIMSVSTVEPDQQPLLLGGSAFSPSPVLAADHLHS
jgi:hypothetical protein